MDKQCLPAVVENTTKIHVTSHCLWLFNLGKISSDILPILSTNKTSSTLKGIKKIIFGICTVQCPLFRMRMNIFQHKHML